MGFDSDSDSVLTRTKLLNHIDLPQNWTAPKSWRLDEKNRQVWMTKCGCRFFYHFLRTPPMLIDGVCPKDMGHPRNDNVTGEHHRVFNEHFRSAYSSSPGIFRAISSYIHLDQNISSPYGSSRIFSGSAWIIFDP